MRQTTIAPPLSAALMTRSFRFLRFRRAVHSSLEWLENLVLRLKFSLRISWRHFLIKKSIDANCPSGGVHFDLRVVKVSKASFSVVSFWSSLSWKNAFS